MQEKEQKSQENRQKIQEKREKLEVLLEKVTALLEDWNNYNLYIKRKRLLYNMELIKLQDHIKEMMKNAVDKSE